jgi:hypothetical protein
LAVAIEKLLSGSEGSLMKLFRALDETKALAELVMQRLSVIAHDIQSTLHLDGPSGPNVPMIT